MKKHPDPLFFFGREPDAQKTRHPKWENTDAGRNHPARKDAEGPVKDGASGSPRRRKGSAKI